MFFKKCQKQSNSDNTISTSSANIDIIIGILKSILQQNQVTLKELAMVCERYELSDRAGAAIASATLKAFGIVTEEDKG